MFANPNIFILTAFRFLIKILMVSTSFPDKLRIYRLSVFSLRLMSTNTDTEAPFLDLHLSIANGFVSSKIYDKRDDFDFDIVNFPFLDGDVPLRASYDVYISQFIRFY